MARDLGRKERNLELTNPGDGCRLWTCAGTIPPLAADVQTECEDLHHASKLAGGGRTMHE
jgi:hypothetical protein